MLVLTVGKHKGKEVEILGRFETKRLGAIRKELHIRIKEIPLILIVGEETVTEV